MHNEKVKITKENKFGDKYTIEYDHLVYDDDDERRYGYWYNTQSCNQDTYKEHCRKQMMSKGISDVSTSQIFDSIEEYFDMMNNLF